MEWRASGVAIPGGSIVRSADFNGDGCSDVLVYGPGPDKAMALVGGYEANLLIFAAATAVAAVVWLGADAERPVERPGEPGA